MKRNMWIPGLLSLGTLAYLFGRRRPAQKVHNVQYTIDPAVFKQPIHVNETPILAPVQTITIPQVRAPHESYTFGLDSVRNQDDITLERYMEHPLESTGESHGNRFKFESVEGSAKERKPTLVRYIRLRVLKTRGVERGRVELGGVRFLFGTDVIHDPEAYIWNPHTGDKALYTGTDPWVDNDQMTVIFCFSEPIEVNKYQFRTSNTDTLFDPTRWILEGSMNASFWGELDNRTTQDTLLPVERGAWMNLKMKGAMISASANA
jgi:hypothetical protein